MKKTIKQHLKSLPPVYRDMVLYAAEIQRKDDYLLLSYNTMHGALMCLFTWDHTKEGHDFWDGIYDNLKHLNQ